VVDERSSVQPQDLRAALAERIAHFKVPERWQITHQPVERTPSGKPIKTALKAGFQ
jgi:acyl-CoA synthetase (AMP-forming)/AMP-acid ligase II